MPVQLPEEILKEVKELQEKFNDTAWKLALVRCDYLKLKKQEDELEKKFFDLLENEKNVIKKLSQNYGDGILDIQTGQYTLSSEKKGS